MVKFGYWLLVELGFILIGTLVMVLLNLSPQASPKVEFYMKWLPYVWFIWVVEVIIHFITGVAGIGGGGWSIAPIGSYDPDSFPAQQISYEFAILVALVLGLFLGGFFYWTVHTTGQVWIPVPRMLIRSGGTFQSIPTSVRDLFSGRSNLGNAIADSVPATLIENYILIYGFMLLIWVPVRVLFTFLTGDVKTANIIGMVCYIVITSLIFPYVFHAWAYQEVVPAYTKAVFFAFLSTITISLTGIPFPAMMMHLGNNAASIMFVSIGYFVVSYIPYLIFIKKRKKSIHRGLN